MAVRSAITLSLVEEARGGPFVFWHDLSAACGLAQELGFDALEIFPPDAAELKKKGVAEAVKQAGLKVAAIGSGAGWVKHQLRLTDPDPARRRAAREFVLRLIAAAAELGAPVIVGSMQGRVGDSVSREQAEAWLAEALMEFAALAHSARLPLFLEPLNRYETNLFIRLDQAAHFLKGLGQPNLKLLADLFHLNIEEGDVSEAVRTSAPLLGHVHFADSNRQAVGFGHTDFAPIVQALREINYDGFVSAECLPQPDSIAAARQTMRSFKRWFPES